MFLEHIVAVFFKIVGLAKTLDEAKKEWILCSPAVCGRAAVLEELGFYGATIQYVCLHAASSRNPPILLCRSRFSMLCEPSWICGIKYLLLHSATISKY